MAFKSIAQRDKMRELLKEGRITQEMYDRHAMETGTTPLPDRLHPKKEEPKKAEEKKKP